jgi:citrate lyase beta subunit
MSPSPTLSSEDVARAAADLARANAAIAAAYPGETADRQPVHTVYGGAHLFRSDTARRLGAAALRSIEEFGLTPRALTDLFGIPESLAPTVHARMLEKLGSQPIEDLRIDFEDGYGNRPDDEEDEEAVRAAREVALGARAGTLPPYVGIRIKPLTDELAPRATRTLDLFLTRLVEDFGGRLTPGFLVTLPKVIVPEQPATLSRLLDALESKLGLAAGTIQTEIMVETPQAIVDADGRLALLPIVRAAKGRCVAAHFGTYDYTAALSVTAAEQRMRHPACDFARHAIQVALAGTGVWISDGATNVLPIAPHGATGRTLTPGEIEANRRAVHAAWKLHYEDVRHSLSSAYYQGWDLHPAQLPTRYAALYAFFLERLDAAAARLANFVAKAGQATVVGEVFDDAATGQGLLNFFLRAWSCGAITEDEAVARSGLTAEELRSRSFLKIVKARRTSR